MQVRKILAAVTAPVVLATALIALSPAPIAAASRTDEFRTEASAAGDRAERVIAEAKRWLGYPYAFGADGPQGGDRAFDCSSFTQYVFSKVGVRLPRTSVQQSKLGPKLSASSLRPGDLMFFNASDSRRTSNGVDHVGIYMGNGRIIHTYSPRVDVTISRFSGNWKSDFLWGVRVLR